MKSFVFVLLVISIAQAANSPKPKSTNIISKFDCLRSILSIDQDFTGVEGSHDVKTLLTLIHNMPSSVQKKVEECGLSLTPAKLRCEGSYGKNNCEKISPAAFQTKCDPYFERVGCCHCAMRCPTGWSEDEYHCIKPQTHNNKVYAKKGECEEAHGKGRCEERADRWSEECGFEYMRVGESMCVAICPEGWHDEGPKCRKPADYRMAQPFLWEQGDD